MALDTRTLIFGISTILLINIAACFVYPQSFHSGINSSVLEASDSGGAIAGRIVSVPVKDYKTAFKTTLQLGQCPLVMKDGLIITCKDKFEGEETYIPRGSTTVDVSRVKSSEDILVHVMGSLGASVGVLGIFSVSPKIEVAVNTDTSRNSLNLMSSYEITRGVLTLHHPRVKEVASEAALFLSEIELGGNELFLVTLGFESENQKVEVELSITFKILFISISAKLNYIKETFNSKASCTIQFKSSWREDKKVYFSSLDACIPKVKEMEDMYMEGPQELRDMSLKDERLHNFYYFSSWKASPYGPQSNLALINHDLEFLTEQNTEIKSVLQRIKKLKDQYWPKDIKKQMLQLNETLYEKTQNLTNGLDTYHLKNENERQQLRDIYGQNKAPLYYVRVLNKITTA